MKMITDIVENAVDMSISDEQNRLSGICAS